MSVAEFPSSSSRHMATKKCGCKPCEQAQWSFWQSHSTTRSCSRVFVRLLKIEADSASMPRRYFVGAVATLGPVELDRNSRRFEQIIGNSPALESMFEQVEQVAPTDSTVLIQGETGTGKELIARAIHNLSMRCGRAFIKLNCAAIPFDLLESELFGHERGAFTGAIAQKVGRFELADKGTLFLDEVGDIPPALHPKLLRVL